MIHNDGSLKQYIALISQQSTDAPTAKILLNTLSATPVWTRAAQGIYKLTLAKEFKFDKTATQFGGNAGNGLVTAYTFQTIGSATPIDYAYTIIQDSENVMSLEVYKTADYSNEDLSALLTTDQQIYVQITIYP